MTKSSIKKRFEKKPCCNCEIVKPRDEFHRNRANKDGLNTWCKECYLEYSATKVDHSAKQKRFYKNNRTKVLGWTKKWRLANKEKFEIKGVVYKALRAGKIQKKPCAFCGNTKVDGHHFDYNKPLEILWLCRKHHKLIHSYLNKAVMEERERWTEELFHYLEGYGEFKYAVNKKGRNHYYCLFCDQDQSLIEVQPCSMRLQLKPKK